MKGLALMALVLTAYCIRELWTLWRFEREIIYPYRYAPDQYNYVQTFWAMYANYAYVAILSLSVWLLSIWKPDNVKIFLFAVFVLALAEMVEYWFNYNLAWFTVRDIAVNITTLRYPILSLIFVYELIKLINLQSWKE